MSANPSIIARHARRVTPELVRDMHAAQDDMGAWAEISRDRIMAVTGRVPLELVKQSPYERAQRVLVGDAPSCKGSSCHGARLPCREHCNPIKEMSVYAPDDDNEARAKSEWDAIVIVGAFALAGLLLAGAVMWLSYTYADPILAVLGRVLN